MTTTTNHSRTLAPVQNSGSRQLLAAMLLAPMLASCGFEPPRTGLNDTEISGETQLASPPAWERRFTQSQIDDVFSDQVDRGNPISRPPLFQFYDDQSQAPDLQQEFGDFNRAAEVHSYINLNQDPLFLAPARFVVAMEAVTSWTRILNEKNEPIFREAFTIDAAGNRIPDALDGQIDGGDQIHFGRFRMPVSVATVSADMQIRLRDTGSWLSADLVNVRDIRAPFVGTVIRSGGFRIALELYPYRKGFLVYGVTAAQVDQFADKMTPEALGSQVGSILNWLSGQLLRRR